MTLLKYKENKEKISVYLICIIVFAVFGSALLNGFVYDDGYLIVRNERIRGLSNIKYLILNDVTVATPIGKASGYYRPISMIFLMLSYGIWGLNAFGFHLNNILIHLISTIMLFYLFLSVSKRHNMALIAALLFAVHPIHVESVTPIYNFMGLLASCLSIGSFLAFVKSGGLKKKGYFALSAGLFFLGLFTKEDVLMLPFVFILFDLYFISDLRPRQVLQKWKYYLGYLFIIFCYLFMRLSIVEKEAALGFWNLNVFFNVVPAKNAFLHILTVIKIYYRYIFLLLFPIRLCAFHMINPVSSMISVDAAVSLIVVSGLIIYAFFARKREPLVSFFIWMFFISSLLTSNIIPIGGLFAERFMYFPSISYCFLFGFCFVKLIDRFRDPKKEALRKITGILCIGFLFLYASQASARNFIWRSDISLWKDTIKTSPKHQLPYSNLAEAYFKEGLYDQALRQYENALKYAYYNEFYIRNTIGKIYGRKGAYDDALREFNRALALNAQFTEVYYNIGITHFHKNDYKGAVSYFQNAMNKDPEYPWSYYGLGLVYEKEGKRKEAIEMFSKATVLNHDFKVAKEALIRIK